MAHYFAYGSNLDARDRARWSRASGLPLRLEPTGQVAWLPDRLLRFHYRSRSRNGGCLDIVPAPGHLAAGALFELDEGSIEALDAKEGAPRWYERLNTVALLDDGSQLDVLTYRVAPARRVGFVAPAEGYVEAVLRGRDNMGVPDDGHVQAAAEDRAAPWLVHHAFVYGTLRPGQARWDLVAPHAAGPARPATVRGELRDLGPYPALLPGEGTVHGDLVPLVDPGAALPSLDHYEGFDGWGRPSLYCRTVLRTDCGVRAWAWRWGRAPRGRKVPGGDWARHRALQD